jgi:hypothetical protein
VIAAQQDFRDLVTSKLSWSGVLGKLKQPIASAEGVVNVTLFVSEDTRHEPSDRIDDYHGGDFASVQDEITNADLLRLQNVDHSLVETFVSTAEQQKPFATRKVFGHRLVESFSLRRQQDASRRAGVRGLDGFDASNRRFHLDQHPGPAAKRFVIDRSVGCRGSPISQIVSLDFNQFALNRFVQQSLAQVSVEDRGE